MAARFFCAVPERFFSADLGAWDSRASGVPRPASVPKAANFSAKCAACVVCMELSRHQQLFALAVWEGRVEKSFSDFFFSSFVLSPLSGSQQK